jgi:hypothetical protein
MKEDLIKGLTYSKDGQDNGQTYVMEDLNKDRTYSKDRCIKGSTYVNLHAQRQLFNAIST